MNAPRSSLWRFIVSLCAAAFGVQSQQNLQHDFEQSKPWRWIVGGVVATLVFVCVLWWWVSVLAANAG